MKKMIWDNRKFQTHLQTLSISMEYFEMIEQICFLIIILCILYGEFFVKTLQIQLWIQSFDSFMQKEKKKQIYCIMKCNFKFLSNEICKKLSTRLVLFSSKYRDYMNQVIFYQYQCFNYRSYMNIILLHIPSILYLFGFEFFFFFLLLLL